MSNLSSFILVTEESCILGKALCTSKLLNNASCLIFLWEEMSAWLMWSGEWGLLWGEPQCTGSSLLPQLWLLALSIESPFRAVPSDQHLSSTPWVTFRNRPPWGSEPTPSLVTHYSRGSCNSVKNNKEGMDMQECFSIDPMSCPLSP